MLQNAKKLFFKEDVPVAVTSVPSVPPPPWRDKEWCSQNKLTPDILSLQQFKRIPIFVCDDMMTGGINHNMIADASFARIPKHPTCYTHNRYTFWKKDLGNQSYPIILPEEYKPSGFVRWPVEPARIFGELWFIEPDAFISLDKHKHNGVRFHRERVKITMPYRFVYSDKKKPLPHISNDFCRTYTAWTYFGIQRYWDPLIGGIFTTSQMETKEHRGNLGIKKFYRFEHH